MEYATFGAGCFWHIEEEFRTLPGVKNTQVGFSGGNTNNPTYKDVCNGNTNHAEVVQIEFDSKQISYDELLKKFWSIHDPTTLNRQGPDIGTQYRSVIFYHNDEQKKKAIDSKNQNQSTLKKLIVTEISEAKEFYKAEEYHQQYFVKNGISCEI